MTKKILISGGSSQVAHYLREYIDFDSVGRSASDKYRWDMNDEPPEIPIEKYVAYINLGAMSSPAECELDPNECLSVNYLSLVNFCERFLQRNPRLRIIQAGSCEQIGNLYNKVVAPQDYHEQQPYNMYGISKKNAADYIRYLRGRGFNASNLILYNHDSKYRRGDYFLRKVVDCIVNDKDLVLGDLNKYRDFSHSHDVARAFVCALDKDFFELPVGSGYACHLEEVVRATAEHLGKPNYPYTINKVVRTDPYVYCANISRTMLTLEWEPTYSLQDIIDDLASAHN